MTIRRLIEVVAFGLALLIAAMSLHAWLASRDEQQRLATTLAQQKQLLDAADTRERTRQSALDDTLAQIEKLKRATLTPQQIVNALPKYLSLPQPIALAPDQQGTVASPQSPAEPSGPVATSHGASAPQPSVPQAPSPNATRASSPTPPIPSSLPCNSATANCAAEIPSVDLKPLYDYVQDCRACQAQLAAAKQNASDDATKISALTAERDAAITAAKGGTFWRRLRRNALWFAVGASAGAAYRASHH